CASTEAKLVSKSLVSSPSADYAIALGSDEGATIAEMVATPQIMSTRATAPIQMMRRGWFFTPRFC
ncbi:hypothetical protein ACLQ2S_17090, partial [Micromonospora sp. DT48]|uniref:hypothetical protein n=1 Tax=Micromonospora sp. DT48 TaxID=3393429 RepID=UPI003CEEF9B8